MTSKTRILTILIPVLLILLTSPLYIPGYILSLLISILMYAVLAVSWMILSSYTGYINLGAAGFFGLGAYMTTIFWPMLPFPIIIVLGGLASGLFALLIGIPCLRVRGPYFVILTFGLSQFLLQAFTLYEVHIMETVGKTLLGGPSTKTFYYSLLAVGVVTVATAHVIKNSKFGLGLFSIRGNEEAAEAMGVNTTSYKLIAFAISSLFMGSVGAIMALRWTYIDPSIAFNPMLSFQVAIMSILGGLRDFRGPILGAVTITLIAEAFGIRFPFHFLIILGIILILLMKFLPTGLLGAIQRLHIGKKLV